ncbi:hypothetical protein HBM99_14350 [Providencia heimbachae]|nr:hypothetical protein [Providencia sp.]NIH23522.1 hypothetical protein [Providencia heimbachae]
MRFLFILMIPILLFSNFLIADNHPGFVCGQFNGNIMEVSNKYVFPFAEYEGYSSFDPRFIENKKGCDANFRFLPMRMSWPEMKPVSGISDDDKMIEVNVEPFNGNPKNYLRDKKYVYEEMGSFKRKRDLFYDEDLELYFNEGTMDFGYEYKNKLYIRKYGYYWYEYNDEVAVFIECSWRQLDESYRRCELLSLIPEFGFKVKIRFEFEEIANWELILEKVRLFLLKHIKN